MSSYRVLGTGTCLAAFTRQHNDLLKVIQLGHTTILSYPTPVMVVGWALLRKTKMASEEERYAPLGREKE